MPGDVRIRAVDPMGVPLGEFNGGNARKRASARREKKMLVDEKNGTELASWERAVARREPQHVMLYMYCTYCTDLLHGTRHTVLR